MMRFLLIICMFGLSILAGCGPNSYTLNRQNQSLLQQQQTFAQQTQELQTRAATLDKDNQDLESLLAQSRQQMQLLKDEATAVRDQLRTANGQLATMDSKTQGLENHTKALAASIKRRAGATIHANNSLMGNLTAIKLPGVEVRQDGDVIRIELPGEKLFHHGSATFKPGATPLIDSVLADVLQNYPNQMIGIEGHTDTDPIRTAQFPSNHHLSVSRAMIVYDHLSRRFSIPEKQLFVVGHGPNHPVVSNASAAGKSRNRRVEVVIYPEQYQR